MEAELEKSVLCNNRILCRNLHHIITLVSFSLCWLIGKLQMIVDALKGHFGEYVWTVSDILKDLEELQDVT